MQVPLYFGNHPKRLFFFFFFGALKLFFFSDKWKQKSQRRKETDRWTRAQLHSYTGQPASPLEMYAKLFMHTNAQALTDASVWKHPVDMHPWDVLQRRAWLLSKVLMLSDTLSRGRPITLPLFATIMRFFTVLPGNKTTRVTYDMKECLLFTDHSSFFRNMYGNELDRDRFVKRYVAILSNSWSDFPQL